MRTSLALLTIFSALALSARPSVAQQSPPESVPASALAPADEYFGHYPLSILGISNTIKLATARLMAGAEPHAVCQSSLAFASDAIAAWEHGYPHDPGISRTLLALERAYLRAGTSEGHERALATEAWLVRDYPSAEATRDAQAEIQPGTSAQL